MWLHATCLGSLALLLSACSDRDVALVGPTDPGDVGAAQGTLSFASFNAAIGVGLAPYALQRLDAIERDLPSLGADVICLQELWQPEDIERLTTALGGEFPYSHRSVRAAGQSPLAGCSEGEAALLLSCLTDNCAEVEDTGLPLCAIANCAPAFTQVAMSCQQCIVANQAAAQVRELVEICSAADGAAVAYENQTGLLLLSKLPLGEPGFLELESSLGDRGVLSGRIDTGAGALDVYCTHLGASLGDVPYTGPYASWQGERLQQIEQFLAWVEQTRARGSAAVLLGDMNCGPATARARSASPDAFDRFVTAGFDAPYADGDGRCTFCGNNPLNGFVTELEDGALIDHILFSGLDSGASSAATRILDDVIEIRADGNAIRTAHSDHYGVQVTVSGVGPSP